jgi:hypothetical protein
VSEEFLTDKLRRYVITFIIDAIAATIIYFSTKNWIAAVAAVFIALIVILVLFYSFRLLEVIKESGIRRIHRDSPDPTPMLQRYFKKSRRIRFLAIRAARMMGTDRSLINYIIEKLPRTWHGRIEILLLSPESRYFTDRALELGKNPDHFADECRNSIHNIIDLKRKHQIDIEIRVYDRRPITRAVIFDDRALLSYYIGKDSHIPIQYEIRGAANSLLRMINLIYDDLWNEAIPAEQVLKRTP